MSEQQRPASLEESLSALVDGQVSELELQRLLKACEQGDELKKTWGRYQVASSVLKGEPVSFANIDFASRVSAAIAEEEALSGVGTVAQKAASGWRYQLGRVALVASVAGGMVLSVQHFGAGTQPSSQVAAAAPAAAPAASPTVNLPSTIINPAVSARTVALQSGFETRPQESRRVTFQSHQAASAIPEEEVTRYVNQMIQAHSDHAAMNAGQGVLPYARVIVTDEE